MFKNGLQIGLMLFGMFFGAGNLIFPPSLGFESGGMFAPAILGFLLSGIGMPVIALIIGTFNPGGFRAEMNQKISPIFSLLLLALIYLSIGPLMAIPRTAATSFSIGVLPITGDGTLPLALFTIVYFAFAWWLAITPTKLLARLGKVLTPMFALLIVILMLTGLLAYTTTSLAEPLGKYSASAFGTGFIEGYNTMDTLASFAFCILALNEMRRIHFYSAREHYTSVWMAGLAVAVLMGALYLGLALLGNHFPIPPEVYGDAHINLGAYVLSQSSLTLFGPAGMYFLAVMVTLLHDDCRPHCRRLDLLLRGIPHHVVPEIRDARQPRQPAARQPRPQRDHQGLAAHPALHLPDCHHDRHHDNPQQVRGALAHRHAPDGRRGRPDLSHRHPAPVRRARLGWRHHKESAASREQPRLAPARPRRAPPLPCPARQEDTRRDGARTPLRH